MLPSVVEATVALENEHWWFVARRSIVSELVRRCVPAGRDRVLIDVGCGAGGTVAALAASYRCLGIDPNPVMIEAARNRSSDARFVCGEIPDDLPPDARSADACLLMDVLEHVATDRDLLAEAMTLCVPGGHLLITVPAGPSLWSRHDEVHGHYRRYTEASLRRLTTEAADEASRPVEIRLLSPYCARLYPFVRVLRGLQGLFGDAAVADDGERDDERGDLFLPPRPLNELLTRVFAGEEVALRRALADERATRAFRHGSSLVAVLRIDDGTGAPA